MTEVESEQPTKEQITKFLEIYGRLDVFEGQHRLTRSWGAFTQEEIDQFPLPDVIAVVGWLVELAGLNTEIDTEIEIEMPN